MVTLKAIVKSKTRNGMYNVYIRITQNRQFAYVRTSWMVNDKGLSDDKKDFIAPFVIPQICTNVFLCKWVHEYMSIHPFILRSQRHLNKPCLG